MNEKEIRALTKALVGDDPRREELYFNSPLFHSVIDQLANNILPSIVDGYAGVAELTEAIRKTEVARISEGEYRKHFLNLWQPSSEAG